MTSAALEHIEYPLDLVDIVVVGYASDRARTFTMRPLQPGTYMLAVWPHGFPVARWTWVRTVTFDTTAGAPKIERFELDDAANDAALDWDWSLTRLSELAGRVRRAEAIFGGFAVARGEIHFEDAKFRSVVRTTVWSCHQPFATSESGKAILDEHAEAIMDWYTELLDQFKPNTIWGEGDNAYSDGTTATDFSDTVYNVPGWNLDPAARTWLTDAYRRMYRYHWSFSGFVHAMRNYAHIMTWDDHEIHDGWGSEAEDFTDGNLAMFKIAKSVAEEYLLNAGPRVNPAPGSEAHQAYISGPQAAFIFDARTSRRYSDPGGRIISDAQLGDFRAFCDRVAESRSVRVLLLGTTVPFVYIKDVLETLGSKAPKAVTDEITGVRDDLRDSWLSPGNQEALGQLLDVVKDLLWRRPGLHVVNVSGDIHVSNAFQMWPLGFPRPIYQVTTSAITNRGHLSSLLSEVMTLSTFDFLPKLGLVRKLWAEIEDPNVLCITVTPQSARFHLRVMPVDGSTNVDQELLLD